MSKQTAWVVLVSQEFRNEVEEWMGWREIAVLKVPQNTRAATVLDQARTLEHPFSSGDRVQVYRQSEALEAVVTVVQVPQLSFEIVDPGATASVFGPVVEARDHEADVHEAARRLATGEVTVEDINTLSPLAFEDAPE